MTLVIDVADSTPPDSRTIWPGATIGFLGGGQLGRMTAFAARSMGYDIHVLDPDANCAARAVASRTITAPFDDVNAALDLASRCDVVTLEIEQIHPDVLDAVADVVPLRPGRGPVYIIQDRLRQKEWLAGQEFPVGAFAAAHSGDDIVSAVQRFGACIAKSTRGGYDGRGQVRISDPYLGHEAFTSLGQQACVVEQRIEIAYEISVLVARRPSGQLAVYPPSRNHHTRGVLTWAVTPAELTVDMTVRVESLAAEIATRLGIVGLLAVECFVTTQGDLLVNELAPRPHNTYHHSERGNATSQFEQLVRAVCNLPLGDISMLAPAAIVNVLGEAWLQTTPPHFELALAVPSSRLHLYGKSSARAGRKMGHLSAVGATAQEALNRALASYRALAPDTTHLFDVHEPLLALSDS